MSKILVALSVACAVLSSRSFAAGENETKPAAALAVWETGNVSGAAGDVDKWTPIPRDKTAEKFNGDAVFTNGKLTVMLRHGAEAVELYSPQPGAFIGRAKLVLTTQDGSPAPTLDHAALVDNSKGAICVEGFYKTVDGASVSAKFRLKKGDIVLEIEPGTTAAALRIGTDSRFAVLPDLFADDMVINPRKITPDTIDIPSENFLLNMMGQGDVILVSVFENKQQDAKLTLAGEGEQRHISGSEIPFGAPKVGAKDGDTGNKIWLAVLEGPQVWHATEVKKTDAGKVVPLDWKMPMAATWRVDFTRPNDLTDSWVMLLQEKPGGEYIKPSWLGSGDGKLDVSRKRWNTVLGTFIYPAWSDAEQKGFLQPLKSEALSFIGPVLVYPIARQKQTPREAFTVMDVVRASLGVGPCEYILDLEGQKGSYKGRATCNTRDTLAGIYKKNEQKGKRAEVDKILDEALVFCTHIRGRIDRYMEFARKMHAYLAEQKKAHPEQSAFIDEMDKLTGEIDARYERRREKIRTLEYVAKLNEEFRKNVLDDTSETALQKAQKYGKELVEVGDNQDELSSECRWAVKALRQRAGLALAMDPKAASIASEIRARTQEALRNPANHEGAQH